MPPSISFVGMFCSLLIAKLLASVTLCVARIVFIYLYALPVCMCVTVCVCAFSHSHDTIQMVIKMQTDQNICFLCSRFSFLFFSFVLSENRSFVKCGYLQGTKIQFDCFASDLILFTENLFYFFFSRNASLRLAPTTNSSGSGRAVAAIGHA